MSLLDNVDDTLSAPLKGDVDLVKAALWLGIAIVGGLIAFDIIKVIVDAMEDAAS